MAPPSKRRKRRKLVAEINITPFTDVILVLLTIFMITTPLLMDSNSKEVTRAEGESKEGGFSVDLPRASKAPSLQTIPSQIVIAILGDGRMALGGESISEDDLKDRLTKVKQRDPKTLIVIQADRMVNHWRVVRVMNIATEVGLPRLAIATVEE
jgi:biopolymer transport protein ExbD